MLRVARRAGVKRSTPRPRPHTMQPCKPQAVPAGELAGSLKSAIWANEYGMP